MTTEQVAAVQEQLNELANQADETQETLTAIFNTQETIKEQQEEILVKLEEIAANGYRGPSYTSTFES